MNLQDQVASLELCKKLKELGVKQKSLFGWRKWIPTQGCSYIKNDWIVSLHPATTDNYQFISAFNVTELLEFLPGYMVHLDEDDQTINLYLEKDDLYTVGYGFMGDYKTFSEKNPCDALAEMLIYLLEEGLIKNEQISS